MRKPKWHLLVGALAALTLLAAACGGDEPTDDPTDGATEPAGGGTAEEVCGADEFGCVEYAEGEPINLGTLLAISGDVATLGVDSQNGVALAIDNLDGALDGTDGQLLGHDVTLTNEDDGCSAEGGQAGATNLAADDSIVAVIGTSCSSAALGVADRILSDEGILLISSSNTNPNLTSETEHQPFYMRTAHNDKIQGAVVAHFAAEQGAASAATIHDESPYADALAAVFRENFEAAGGTITGDEAIQSTDTDFAPLLTSIAEGEPDVLYYPNFNPACGLLAQQGRDTAGLEDTIFIGSDGCAAPDYGEVGGEAVNGSFLSAPDLSGFEQGDFYQNEFLPAYEELTGGEPTAAFHAHAYDAANILFAAINEVAIEEDGTLFIPRTELRDTIFATSGYEGLTGEITCNELGDCATSVTIAVYEVPEDPFVGGKTDAEPVFSETLTLEDVGG